MRTIDADALVSRCGDYYVEEGPEYGFIGTLKCLVDMQPTVGGWISVKDRLPDQAGYECLVRAVNENYNQSHIFTAHTGYGEPGWWTSNVHYMAKVQSPSDNRVHPAFKITHWMPLPEPPKEDKHEI